MRLELQGIFLKYYSIFSNSSIDDLREAYERLNVLRACEHLSH
jgi:hypothetical protein